ncbi:MAG: PaREP1 family protein [Pyrobaculum sp.]|uniref:PaREP1 n=1 Tax=Pyrobaculum aerophilum TaxID=13773 RepID=A0A371QW09_9CREN|nr:PaREP1 family protein [Pyrobaculum aerophilum]RFA94308.1 hypothetical protein CGL51_10425 [Pyrobaculum aerophilum]RFA95720.1 hypothetical protein CGL52_12420 [Pyrobaculum aerophilum]
MEILEKPLPKPTSEDYISARLLEALVEARLAVEFLGKGLIRNAAGKAFQAWKALLAALLRLELERLKAMAKTEEERKWLETTAVARVPTTRLMSLSLLLEKIGYRGLTLTTAMALSLHDYQYHGPDPDLALSKFRNRQEAASATAGFITELVKMVENLRTRAKWSNDLEKAIDELKKSLSTGL